MEMPCSLVMRLAGPLQSWGVRGQFNRRETAGAPTKSGIVGLLAAAQGRARGDAIDDLVALSVAVRTDQPGSLLRDYHTVSDYRGVSLPSASVTGKGVQKRTGPAKLTQVTERYYLQDAVFVVAVCGPAALLASLLGAMTQPAYPLALGRRACAPTQPLVLRPGEGERAPDCPGLWVGDPLSVLRLVSWQASAMRWRSLERQRAGLATIDLPVVIDDPVGDDTVADVPRSFEPRSRSFSERPVRHTWVSLPTRLQVDEDAPASHDPFALLRW
jgi:CRISPR system Cascade subunit CasD